MFEVLFQIVDALRTIPEISEVVETSLLESQVQAHQLPAVIVDADRIGPDLEIEDGQVLAYAARVPVTVIVKVDKADKRQTLRDLGTLTDLVTAKISQLFTHEKTAFEDYAPMPILFAKVECYACTFMAVISD
jgi:hypothetical protein